jgi:hypothetical protein
MKNKKLDNFWDIYVGNYCEERGWALNKQTHQHNHQSQPLKRRNTRNELTPHQSILGALYLYVLINLLHTSFFCLSSHVLLKAEHLTYTAWSVACASDVRCGNSASCPESLCFPRVFHDKMHGAFCNIPLRVWENTKKNKVPRVSHKGMEKKRSPRGPYISYALLWCEHEKETLWTGGRIWSNPPLHKSPIILPVWELGGWPRTVSVTLSPASHLRCHHKHWVFGNTLLRLFVEHMEERKSKKPKTANGNVSLDIMSRHVTSHHITSIYYNRMKMWIFLICAKLEGN